MTLTDGAHLQHSLAAQGLEGSVVGEEDGLDGISISQEEDCNVALLHGLVLGSLEVQAHLHEGLSLGSIAVPGSYLEALCCQALRSLAACNTSAI